MVHFGLKEWRKVGLATEKVTLAVLSIEDEVPDYLLLPLKFMVSAINLRENGKLNFFVEFPNLFPTTIPNILPPLRTINYRICLKLGPKWVSK